MAHIPRTIPDKLFSRNHPITPDDEVVISGISGSFPYARDMNILSHNLYNKIDMVNDHNERWKHFSAEIPKRMGIISDLEKFDASFFGVNFKQAHVLDPQARILLEKAYEAVLDAGVNPKSLRGGRTGVFVGSSVSDTEKTFVNEKTLLTGYGLIGYSRFMLANRISYALGLTGPSCCIDTGCSSSIYALDMALSALRSGECDSALVGASNLLREPSVSLQFLHLGALAADGFCRPFDIHASGYSRSEAISVIFLQKARDANRNYGNVLYSKTNCDGHKSVGITYPSCSMQEKLLTEFYNNAGVDPIELAYIEAHGTGTVVGDPIECQALDTALCTNRSEPLLVGSVKSNLGHSEASSGMCSIAKVILAFETGNIAPNINFTKNRPDIPSLEEGRLKVVSDITKLKGSIVGINSFGMGGANSHALLKRNPIKKENKGAPNDSLPRLVCWAGRTDESINIMLDALESQPLDVEFIGLLHKTQSDEITGYIYRGYGLYNHTPDGNAKCLGRDSQEYTGFKRPIVWIFSGMGSQWPEMGTSLMEIDIFRNTIKKCHDALVPHGLNLINIITSSDPKMFDNILNSFVGIAAIQVAIVDVLRVLGLEADYYIGHSVGELGCAYADGCFTPEQMVLSAYSRGMASLETEKIRGSMAAIGLGYKTIKNMLPPTIDCACHNGPDSSTISGPEEDVAKFVDELKQKGIFAKEVSVSNIAYHSRYIVDVGVKLFSRLTKVIPVPQKRSQKWLSSSVPKNRWEMNENQYSSAEYHTNNLLNTVLFEETLALLPTNVITIEIAPHGLLQSILKKSMTNGLHIPLTQRGNKQNLTFFLGAMGKLFLAGLNIPIERIYPAIKFPVSRGTPMIAPLIRWNHSEDWFVTKFELPKTTRSAERRVNVSLTDPDYEFLAGHIIDGRILIPATAYLQLIWETFAMSRELMFFDMNIEFKDIKFLRATTISKEQDVELTIVIHPGSGHFEITENNSVIVNGIITEILNPVPLTVLPPLKNSDFPMMQERDFYKELRLRGYHYNGDFRAVSEARGDGMYGKVKWDMNWTTFMDCILQISILSVDTRLLLVPTKIKKLTINAKEHMTLTTNLDPENPFFEVFICDELSMLRSGGIEIDCADVSFITRRKVPSIPVLESYQFIPNLMAPKLSKSDVGRICVQIGLEINPMLKTKVVEVNYDNNDPLISYFDMALEDLPLITADLILLTARDLNLDRVHVEDGKISTQSNCTFIIGYKCLERPDFVGNCKTSLCEKGYIITRESPNLDIKSIILPNEFQLIGAYPIEDETIVMLQRIQKTITVLPEVIHIDQDYGWLEQCKQAVKNHPTILVDRNDLSGILGLVNCIRKEPDGGRLSCILIDDKNAPPFDLEDSFYKAQLQLGMAINIYRNGEWGTFRHLELKQDVKEIPRSDHCFANVLQRGEVSTLSWIQGHLNLIINKNAINIHYASVNRRDVMLATGRLFAEVFGAKREDYECVLGTEYAGVDQRGERVMGITISGSLATQVVPNNSNLVWKVPDDWTLQDAATCPIAYWTVNVAFFYNKQIEAGKSILIHAGSSNIGLAAIRVATAYGLTVYTTVSTPQEKKNLLNTFPALKGCHISYSQDCTFEHFIKLETKGSGVDYVFNSLDDDKFHASITCFGRGDTFLRIGKFNMSIDTRIDRGYFLTELNFSSMIADNSVIHNSANMKRLHDLIEKDLMAGIIKPLYNTVFEVHELEKACRYLSTGKHVGSVIVRVREDEHSKFTVPMKVLPRAYCNSDLVYIILGGLGGFGLELADWLVIRGARKLVISSRRGISKSYQSYRIKRWESYGTKVLVTTVDITKFTGCEKLLSESLTLGQIGGIFNLAVSVHDAIFGNQTVEKFAECMAPKAIATKHLDDLSRKMCPQLKYFVVFSSLACGRGNAGQSNYGMANSVMERIIEKRDALGLPAKAIQWGAIGEVGYLEDMAEVKLDLEIGGTLQQRITSCLQELDVLLTISNPIVSSMVVAQKQLSDGRKYNLIESILNIMSIRNIKSISMFATLSDVGMDSLMAVEIKQTLERDFQMFLEPKDIRDLTFVKLQELTDVQEKNQMDGAGIAKLRMSIENMATELNLFLQTLGEETTSDKTILRLTNSNINSKNYTNCLLIVPGIEGVAGPSWIEVTSGIHQPAFALQITDTIDKTSISDIAEVVQDAVIEVFKNQEFFYLVGYSFGALVTLELARILEKWGMKGHILLIDGAPVFSKRSFVDKGLNEIFDKTIQIISRTRIQLTKENPDDLFLKLTKYESWIDKVNYLLDFDQTHADYSETYLRKMLLGIYNRSKISVQLDIENVVKIKTPITLVRPTDMAVVDIKEDYELSRYTDGPINLKFIEGNHTSMLRNPELANIINECAPNVESDREFAKHFISG